MPDARIDPYDVGALERSVNDSAGRVSGIWLSFVAFTAYLAAAASMISHRQIFLEEPIKLPTINIDLPLVASAILLPLLFVVYHLYVLLQVVLLSRTADAYNEAIDHNVTDDGDRIRIRQRLANTLFAQLFAGSRREREGLLGLLLRLMTWITLAIAPVGVLVIFEIKFLPYHSSVVTWTHRGLIAFDLLAVLVLWAGAMQPGRDMTLRSFLSPRLLTIGAIAVLILSNSAITFPGEPGRIWMRLLTASNQSSDDMRDCQIPALFEDVIGPGFDRLILPGEDFVDDGKLDRILATIKANDQAPYESERTRIFRSRDLRCARLPGADLRHVDFAESDLSGAILRAARLEGATFAGARLAGANLDTAQLQGSSFGKRETIEKNFPEAQLPNASLQGAQLAEAYLTDANLEAAKLQRAQLTGAWLERANLRGASLQYARLDRAHLDGARLQGVSFQSASMRGTILNYAHMHGASFTGARMIGASFDQAIMHGASFYGGQLQWASFYRTELQGAQFKSPQVAGATFVETQMQGIQVEGGSGFRNAILYQPFLWHAGRSGCNLSHVANANFDDIIQVQYESRSGPVRVKATEQEVGSFIDRSLEDVPEGAVDANFSRDKLRAALDARLRHRRIRSIDASRVRMEEMC